jgi:hypothetical protein
VCSVTEPIGLDRSLSLAAKVVFTVKIVFVPFTKYAALHRLVVFTRRGLLRC